MYTELAKKKKFLRQGGTAPLQPTKSYIRINFGSKGTEIVHLWFPKIHILLWKEGLPPYSHQKSYISVNLDQKNYACLAHKIQNFLRKESAAPLQPMPGGNPRERLVQVLSLLALLTVACTSPPIC